jgi:uncharacterized protein
VDAADIIDALGLVSHPEGGWYRETHRTEAAIGDGAPAGDLRPLGTAIYFLLVADEWSHWHLVLDGDEIWHHYAGAALELWTSADGISRQRSVLGVDLEAGERPQLVVPSGTWQAAVSLGDWTLIGATVVPGFTFDRWELAPPGWEPGRPRAGAGDATIADSAG